MKKSETKFVSIKVDYVIIKFETLSFGQLVRREVDGGA